MTFPQVLEVAIGLVLLYYVLGSVVSAFTQLMMDSLEVRATILTRYLIGIFGADLMEILQFPQIRTLQPIKYKNWIGIFGATAEPKRIERIPIPILVNAMFDHVGLSAEKTPSTNELKTLIERMPESEAKSALLKWYELGILNINDLRERVTEYFTGIMEQVEGGVSASSRSFMISLSLMVTLLLGIDTFQVAKELWNNADLRAVSNAAANVAADQGGKNTGSAAASVDMSKLSFKIGWMAKDYPVNASAADWLSFLILKILGLGITIACVSQGSAFWYGLLKKLD